MHNALVVSLDQTFKLFFGSPDSIASEIRSGKRHRHTRIFIALQGGLVRALGFFI